MANKLLVELHRQTCVGDEPVEGVSPRYLDINLRYTAGADGGSLEGKDRDWFSVLVGFNPTMDNLSEAVGAAAEAMISQVNPLDINLTVRLSNDPDKHGFCSKTVYFVWTKEE